MGVESVIDGKAIGQAITQSAETCDMVGLVSILSQIAMGFIILVTMLSRRVVISQKKVGTPSA